MCVPPTGIVTPLVVTVLLSHSSGCPRTVMAGVGARMLIVFAPQVLLYGLAVVLYGILQSYRRFYGPALAPLLSSLVVIAAYAAFGAIGGAYAFGNRLHELPPLSEYLLSGGTTLGVLALVATAVFPARRLGLQLRPMLRFPPGVGTRPRTTVTGRPKVREQRVRPLPWSPCRASAARRGGRSTPRACRRRPVRRRSAVSSGAR